MTEITRVPLQPIARGSLPKLWLGVLAAIAVAAPLLAVLALLGLVVFLRGASPTFVYQGF